MNLISALSKNKEVRLYLLDSTDMVNRLREMYDMTPVSIAALGRTVTAASILGKTLKNEKDKLTIQIKGNGPIQSIIAVSKANGFVKGYISHPHIKTKLKDNGKLDVGYAVGNEGNIYVIRDYGLKEPYIGHSKLVSGEIAEDLANYYMFSEQQPSVFSLGVYVDSEGSVASAGGLVIQTLPNVSEESIVEIEKAMKELKPISTLISESKDLKNIIQDNFKALEFEITEESTVDIYCDCSKERMLEAIRSLGNNEIQEMIDEDQGAEIHCHFCNTSYEFDEETLDNLIKE